MYTVQIEPLSQNPHPTLIVIRQRIHIEETFVLMIIMTPMNIGVTNKGKRNFSIKLEFSIISRQRRLNDFPGNVFM